MRHTHLAAVTAAGTLLVTGCASEDAEPPVSTTTDTATDTVTEEATVTPSPDVSVTTATPRPSETIVTTREPTDEEPPEDEAPFPADRADDTADASADARLSPTNLRFGYHEDYDRIVLDLAGPGEPGWRAGYVDEPALAGSGQPVDLDGDAFLRIAVDGVVHPTEDGAQEYQGPDRIDPDPAGIVEEVVYGSVFEGETEVFVGLSSDQPFRVFRLEDPTRVVIDVQHP
ncbi:hypothetical protein [Demequina sp. NBRC 110053]|uniref:AMIN-like domain-containing (lipo)protein n=1 Tax=Demequina sp. NBRC 110053 TaxID=1570342 RepID=UPI001186D3BC|nr:hypothetical protein [Demequina sp. NBRC 110053]